MTVRNREAKTNAGNSRPPSWLLLSAIVLLCVSLGSPRTFGMLDSPGPKKDLYRRVAEATLIVRGTVVDSEAKWQDEYQEGKIIGRGIYTTVKFAVSELIKGSLQDSTLFYDVAGGTVEEQSEVVYPRPDLPVTEKAEAILFFEATPRGLEPYRDGVITVHYGIIHLAQGRIPVNVYTQYLRLISDGEKMTLDSFLQAMPPQPPPPAQIGGGTLPPGEVRIFESSDTSSLRRHHDTVEIDPSWLEGESAADSGSNVPVPDTVDPGAPQLAVGICVPRA